MANGGSWQVTSQVADQQTITDAGQVVTGIRVYFITGLGQRGSVLVPDDQYNTATVAAMVGIMADRMDQVATLTDAAATGGQ